MLDYISQFINIRRFKFEDFQIVKLNRFVERRFDFNGKKRYSRGFEHKVSDRSFDKCDDRTDYIYSYVFDESGVYILRKAIYFRDGYKIDEGIEEEVRNARELLTIAEWFLRPNIPDYYP